MKATVHKVTETSRSKHGVSVLEVSLWIETPNGAKEYKGEDGPDGVFLDSDSGDYDEEDLKDLMRDVATRWRQTFRYWEREITRKTSAGVEVPSDHEEVIAEALRMEGHQDLADKVRDHGTEALDYQGLDRATYAIDMHIDDLPSDAHEVHQNLLDIANE